MMVVSLYSFSEACESAQRLSHELGVPLSIIEVHRFPDGEIKVATSPPAEVAIVYAPLDRPNDKLLALLFTSEALRRQGARRVVLVAPYLCYMRQDVAFQPGQAISQKVIGKLIADNFDRVITVNAHLHRTKQIGDIFPNIETSNLSAIPAIADALAPLSNDKRTIVAGPDEESEPWVRDLALRLCVPYVIAHKTRHGDCSVVVDFPCLQLIAGKDVILLDDMISSGGTIVACTKALRAAGAKNIDVLTIHALFGEKVDATFTAAGICSVRSTDSVPHTTNNIYLATTLARSLRCEFQSRPNSGKYG